MSPEIASIALKAATPERAELEIGAGDGKTFAFPAAAPAEPAGRLGKDGFAWGAPALFVRAVEPETVGRAVAAMAAELGGYWLRIYSAAARERPAGGDSLKVARVELGEVEPKAKPKRCAAVVQAWLSDGREFSILAATPAWFTEAFAAAGLEYFYGPQVLFLSAMEAARSRRAVQDMLAHGDRWLCLYDTPRTTLARVLTDFKAKHGA